MPNDNPSLIGHLSEILPGEFTATLLSDDEGFSAQVQLGEESFSVGRLSSYVAVRGRDAQVLAQVTRMWRDETLGRRRRKLSLMPLGQIVAGGGFQRGIDVFPVVDAEVHLLTGHDMEVMFNRYRERGLNVGRVSQYQDLNTYLDPDNLFSRHLAILGQSGAGKSWTVTALLQRTVKQMPNAHIVVLDLHGEYAWHDQDGTLHSAFGDQISRHVDARELEIPYWLLTFAELVDLLIDRSDPNAPVQIAFVREALHELRRKANTDLGIERISVDSPVYFPIRDLYAMLKRANEQQLDFGKTKGPLFGAFTELMLRFQAMYNDSRYDFLFKPRTRTKSQDLEGLLRDFIGLGKKRCQVTIIDLSVVPHDVRPTISAQIGRLAFEFNYWNPRRREFPIMLVCEEAHQYIPRQGSAQHEGTRRAIERIAKEGRKYGVNLCVISQRPLELSETVLAQCANFICMRITNPDDQAYVSRLMPQGERNLTDVLAALRRGEALIVGEAVALPTRVTLTPPDPPPASSDIPIEKNWREGPQDLDVQDIVTRWWKQQR